jgi:uncharacterized protein YjbI with pentapeptide repeats/tetratricopeptide (TPR) repeat protein
MIKPLTPEELGILFQEIEFEPTSKLSELAKVAELNLAIDYVGVDLSGDNLSEDDLSGVNFSGSNLSNVNFKNTKLTNSNLSKAILIEANLQGADLSGADLSGADLSRANFRDANLNGVNFIAAKLQGANFRGANLSNGYLIGVDFKEVDFSEANLSGTTCIEESLIRVYFSGKGFTRVEFNKEAFITKNFSGEDYLRENFSEREVSRLDSSGINFEIEPENHLQLANRLKKLVEDIKGKNQEAIETYKIAIPENNPPLAATGLISENNIQGIGAKFPGGLASIDRKGEALYDYSTNPETKQHLTEEDHISIAKPKKNDLVYDSTIKFCEEVFTSKIEKNKFQEITSQKINAVLQGNNISGGNVSNTGVFQNTTIEGSVIFLLESSGEAPKNESAPLPENIPENFSRRKGAKKFVGRDDVIEILHEQLKVTEQVAITSVTGMGGIGKTELALQYAHFHLKQKTYTGGICWLNCRGQNVGPQIISFAISKFNLSFSKDDDLQTQIDSCWHNWPDGNVLVIFDDVVNYKDISDFLPPGKSRFKVLITTRQKWLTQSFQRLELEVLDKDAALELLMSYVEHSRIEAELQEAKELCKDLGFLPLGLELIARYLERKPSLSLVEVRKTLGLEDKSLERFSQDMTAQIGVVAAFELSWNELDEDSKALGCLLSLFASAPIPWDLVEKCLLKDESQEKGIIQQWFPTFLRLLLFCMPRKAANVLDLNTWKHKRDNKLINFSLLQYLGGSNYGLHPLIRQYFRDKFAGFCSSVEEMKYSICKVIAESAGEIPENITVQQVSEVEVYIPHIVEVAENLYEFLSDDDLITPFIGLGRFYKGQGLYPLAQPWLEKGKEIAEKRLDKNNSDIAAIYNNLALLYELQGKYEAAEPLFLKAIEIGKISLPENHLSIARGLNNLASLYKSQGKYEAAESLYLQAIEIDKIALPENHPQLATHLNNLASLYESQGKYEAAEPLFLQAIEIDKIALPENHPQLATDLNNLASLYESQGKYEAAEPLYLQAIEIDKIALPENHPSLATYLNNLAGLYKSQGKYEAAEPLYLQAIEIFTQSLGEEHPNTQKVLKNYQIFLNEKNESK